MPCVHHAATAPRDIHQGADRSLAARLQGPREGPAVEHRHVCGIHKLAQTGPLISHSGPPHPGFGEATNTYVLSDMAARVLVENWEPEKAADEARKKLVAIWTKYKD